MSAEDYRKHKAAVTQIAGEIFISLPDDGYMRLTPEQARQIGGRLFILAAEALGQERPEVIVLR